MEEPKGLPEETIEEQPKASFLDKLKPHKLKILIGILGVLVFAGVVFGAYKIMQTKQGVKPKGSIKCTQDSDCILVIRLDQCCSCPKVISRDALKIDLNLTEYVEGKDYSQEKTVNCEGIECASCGPLPHSAVCFEGMCQIEGQTIIDETTDWETYTNTKYGYSIKYPAGWYLDGELGIIANKEIRQEEPVSPETQDLTNFVVKIMVLNKDPLQSLGDWVSSDIWWPATEIAMERPKPRSREAITIGEAKGFRLEYGTEEAESLYVFLEKNNSKVFQISGLFDYRGEEDTFNLMLSTFKFLDQNQTDETVNWETYRNEKYGFEIKYPPDWTADVQDSTVLFSENGPSGSRIGLNSPQKTMYGDPFWIHIYRISQVYEQTALDNFKIFHAGDPCLDCSTQEVRLGNEDFLRVTEQKGGYIGYIKIRDSKYFEISYEDPGVQKLNEQIEQILSTFKFLD